MIEKERDNYLSIPVTLRPEYILEKKDIPYIPLPAFLSALLVIFLGMSMSPDS